MAALSSCSSLHSQPPRRGSRPCSPKPRKLCTIACTAHDGATHTAQHSMEGCHQVGAKQARQTQQPTGTQNTHVAANLSSSFPDSETLSPRVLHTCVHKPAPLAAVNDSPHTRAAHLHPVWGYVAAVDVPLKWLTVPLSLSQHLVNTLQPQQRTWPVHTAQHGTAWQASQMRSTQRMNPPCIDCLLSCPTPHSARSEGQTGAGNVSRVQLQWMRLPGGTYSRQGGVRITQRLPAFLASRDAVSRVQPHTPRPTNTCHITQIDLAAPQCVHEHAYA